MSLLKMNVDTVREVQRQILAAEKQMTQSADALNQRVNAMVGVDWKADAATQFQQDFQAWMRALQAQMQGIAEEGRRLGQEADRWEEVARSY